MSERSGKTKPVVTLIPVEAHERLEKFAKRRGANISGIVRIALVEYLRKEGEDIDIDDLLVGEWGGKRREG